MLLQLYEHTLTRAATQPNGAEEKNANRNSLVVMATHSTLPFEMRRNIFSVAAAAVVVVV